MKVSGFRVDFEVTLFDAVTSARLDSWRTTAPGPKRCPKTVTSTGIYGDRDLTALRREAVQWIERLPR